MGRIDDVADETIEAITKHAQDSGLAPNFVVAQVVWQISNANLSSQKWRDDVNDGYWFTLNRAAVEPGHPWWDDDPMTADPRRPRDMNSLAARIVAEATGQAEKTEPPWDDDSDSGHAD